MLSFYEMIAKIGPADPEIIVLQAIIKKRDKKKEINASKIYNPSGLPIGLNEMLNGGHFVLAFFKRKGKNRAWRTEKMNSAHPD